MKSKKIHDNLERKHKKTAKNEQEEVLTQEKQEQELIIEHKKLNTVHRK